MQGMLCCRLRATEARSTPGLLVSETNMFSHVKIEASKYQVAARQFVAFL